MKRSAAASLAPWLLWACTADAADGPSYAKDVAPILRNNCAGCHRPGEVGPFSLLTYKDAAKRADFLKEITASRRMPPWKPEPGYGEFHDARRLSDAEIDTIARWVDAGAPEGNASDALGRQRHGRRKSDRRCRRGRCIGRARRGGREPRRRHRRARRMMTS